MNLLEMRDLREGWCEQRFRDKCALQVRRAKLVKLDLGKLGQLDVGKGTTIILTHLTLNNQIKSNPSVHRKSGEETDTETGAGSWGSLSSILPHVLKRLALRTQ